MLKIAAIVQAGLWKARINLSKAGRKWLWVLLAAWCLIGIACTTMQSYHPESPATTPGATFVGVAACVECHQETIDAFKGTAHALATLDAKHACESCHGPASLHAKAGEGSIVKPNDATCLQCHARDHGTPALAAKLASRTAVGTWSFSSHRTAGVHCIDCHNPHTAAAKEVKAVKGFRAQHVDATSSLCISCHQDVLSRISMPYRHPIREGAMGCTSCHDPHGNPSRELLAKNETCASCHQAQQGPFSHEHQPVVEDCTTCHNPHGSPHPKMVNVAQPMLCLQCHSLTLNRHNNVLSRISPAALRECTACHGVVHGSDMDAYFRH